MMFIIPFLSISPILWNPCSVHGVLILRSVKDNEQENGLSFDQISSTSIFASPKFTSLLDIVLN